MSLLHSVHYTTCGRALRHRVTSSTSGAATPSFDCGSAQVWCGVVRCVPVTSSPERGTASVWRVMARLGTGAVRGAARAQHRRPVSGRAGFTPAIASRACRGRLSQRMRPCQPKLPRKNQRSTSHYYIHTFSEIGNDFVGRLLHEGGISQAPIFGSS